MKNVSRRAKIFLTVLTVICYGGCNDAIFIPYSSYCQAGAIIDPYILALAIVFGIYCFYLMFFKVKEEEKEKKKGIKGFIITLVAALAIPLAFYYVTLCICCGWACVINRYIGKQEKMVMTDKVIEMHHERRNDRLHPFCRVLLEEPNGKQVMLDLPFDHERIEVGDTFSKAMYKGCLGFYYLTSRPE